MTTNRPNTATLPEASEVRIRNTLSADALRLIAREARSAADIFHSVHRAKSTASMGSIYRALDVLCDLGLAQIKLPPTREAALKLCAQIARRRAQELPNHAEATPDTSGRRQAAEWEITEKGHIVLTILDLENDAKHPVAAQNRARAVLRYFLHQPAAAAAQAMG